MLHENQLIKLQNHFTKTRPIKLHLFNDSFIDYHLELPHIHTSGEKFIPIYEVNSGHVKNWLKVKLFLHN